MHASSAAHDWDAQAADEAASFTLTTAGEKHIAQVLSSLHGKLPNGQLREHRVGIVPDAWQPYTTELPAHVVEGGSISRGDVLNLAAGADSPDSLWRLWLATFVWGSGGVRYMPRRLGRILAATPAEQLADLVGRARDTLAAENPIAAYAVLRGRGRACAAPRWGPAFFTKLLYFVDHARPGSPPRDRPAALILDARLAKQVSAVCDNQWLLRRHRAYTWSDYRYGVYLHWMRQTAQRFDVPADRLECALFLAEGDGQRAGAGAP